MDSAPSGNTEAQAQAAGTNGKPRSFVDHVWLALATFFGAGRMPVAPGTWGSLAAIVIYWLALQRLPLVALIGIIVVVSALGVVSATEAERILGKHDPGSVVIDEVAGQLVSVCLIHGSGQAPLLFLGVSFVAFRVFDVVKPWPCYQLQSLPRGWGVMADDIVAGVYAAIVTFVVALLR